MSVDLDKKALEAAAKAIKARVPIGYGMTDAEALDYARAALSHKGREGS